MHIIIYSIIAYIIHDLKYKLCTYCVRRRYYIMTLTIVTRLPARISGVSKRYETFCTLITHTLNIYIYYMNNVHVVVCLQVLRGRSFLPVREQDPVRIRLRGTAGVRQHGHVQLVQSGAHKKASQ